MTKNNITENRLLVQAKIDKEFVEQYQVAKKLGLDPVKILDDAIKKYENEIREAFWNSAPFEQEGADEISLWPVK